VSRLRRAAVAGAAVATSLVVTANSGGALQTETPPATITNNCTKNVTARLSSWLNSRPKNSQVAFHAGACYLVSSSASSLLTLNGTTGLTLNGHGATLKQASYTGGTQPILSLYGNTNLTVENLTLNGPGGSGQEGDYGIMVGGTNASNIGVTFNGVTVENVAGDGLAVYPQLGFCCGINTVVVFENGAMSNIGYHGFTPEGVNGLDIYNNTLNVADMDMEVDIGQYGPPFNACTDTAAQGLTGVAQCNISIVGNRFVHSGFSVESSSNGACIPSGNLQIVDNTFTEGSSLSTQVEGSQSAACPRDNGLTITGNVVVPDANFDGASGWYSCSIASPSLGYGPCGAALDIADYQNVDVENNQFLMAAGNPNWYADTIYTQSLALQGDENVTIKNNGFNNGWNIWGDAGYQWTHNEYTNVNITECGNSYWLTKPMFNDDSNITPPASPKYDAAC
jgi:hypothetical protein